MKYDVLECVAIGADTSVTIAGNGQGLKNGVDIRTAKGNIFKVLSIAMYSGAYSDDDKTTTLLVEGNFEAKSFEVV